MSRKRRRQHAASEAPRAAPGRLRLVVILAVVAVASVLVTRSWRSEPASPAPAPARGDASSSGAAPRASAPGASAAGGQTSRELRPLLGEWVRPDGGYVLSIQEVASDGSATVQYFNPRPIRVARAEARHEDGVASLFVEFDDVNYPGSTYTLAYDATSDALRGVYFQAVQQARYEVAFVRRR